MGFGAFVGMMNYGLFFENPAFKFGNLIDSGQIGMLNLVLVVCFAAGSSLTSKLGAKLSQRVPEKKSRQLFATLLVIIGGKIFYQTLSIFNWRTIIRSLYSRSLNCGGVVKLVITPACHAGGREFESRRSRHLFKNWITSVVFFFAFFPLKILLTCLSTSPSSC